jgi:hypothetical protein
MLVKPTRLEDKRLLENLPAAENILKILQCQLGISLVALRELNI